MSLNIWEALCKHGGMEGEIRERVMKGRSVVGSLAGVMKGRKVSMDVKRGLRNTRWKTKREKRREEAENRKGTVFCKNGGMEREVRE